MRLRLEIIFLGSLFFQCGRIASLQDQASAFFRSLVGSPTVLKSGSEEICDLSILELGDGGLMFRKDHGEIRPVLFDYFVEVCGTGLESSSESKK